MTIDKTVKQQPSTAKFATSATPIHTNKRLANNAALNLLQTDPATRFIDNGQIGQGGMSTIKLMFDKNLARYVARKELKSKIAQSVHGLTNFVDEAKLSGQLEHPNILPVYDFGVDQNNTCFFDMQLVEGQTLRQYILSADYDQCSNPDLFRVVQLFIQVCHALSFAHSRGVIHRDLKPGNIMLCSHGRVYLLDWGIACVLDKETNDNAGINEYTPEKDASALPKARVSRKCDEAGFGTLAYLAPELTQGYAKKVDKRTDIFALGGILYFILTKQAPFTGSDRKKFEEAEQCKIVPPQEIVTHGYLSPQLCRITMKALSKDPNDRYASVDHLISALEAYLQGSDRFPQKMFGKGEPIIQEGDEGDEAYCIITGLCDVNKTVNNKEVKIRQLGPGDVFGEAAIFSMQPRTANVVALTDVTVIVVSHEVMYKEMGHNSWISRFVKTLADRFTEIDTSLNTIQNSLEDAQLLNRILFLFNIYGKHNGSGTHHLSARWQLISDDICQHSSITTNELRLQLARLQLFDIDVDNDMISFDTGKARTLLSA